MKPTDNISPTKKRALLALQEMQSKLNALEHAKTEPIAIIGLSCRFPGGADNQETFWQLLREGRDAIIEVPKERWDIDAYYDPDPDAPGKMCTRYGGFLLGPVDQFDPQFFGISPREANSLDPQQRLLLELSWEALECANLVPEKIYGSSTGVFVGITSFEYGASLFGDGLERIDAYSGTGGTLGVAAGRLSYVLGLTGPSLILDTACSASLVATHLACQSLRLGESDLALVGGVNLTLRPETYINFSKAKMLAPDGRCKTFDAAADGYARGEGGGIVILKRLSDAVADGDNIYAQIRGSAVNQDGPSGGLTVPNGPSQVKVIHQALANAGVTPDQVSYIEAHGTGTSLGDPIEMGTLSNVFGLKRYQDNPLTVGSVKTNIGHLEAAAGMAGLIKVVLSLQHKEIPPHLHFKQPSPHIDWDEFPVVIPTERQPWHTGEQPRIAGISSFGFSGTNAHIVLEEAPTPTSYEAAGSSNQVDRPLHLLTLSAKKEEALRQLAKRYLMSAHSDLTMADISFTANTRRSHFIHRLAIVAASTTELGEKLTAFTAGQTPIGLIQGKTPKAKSPKVVFLFTGQGSQYAGMGRELYETQPTFRQTLERCDEILRPYLETPLLEILYSETTNQKLDETAYTQPALFALEYALAELWQSWGIKPAIVLGHSVGEYVAACVSGIFSLEDGLKLIAERGRLMQSMPQEGDMVAVFADEATVADAIASYTSAVSIAALNEPGNVVISGKAKAIQTIVAALETSGIETRQLNVSHAFHSPLMEPMLEAFEQVASQVSFQEPRIPLISNVTGQILEQVPDAQYWRTHTRSTVDFMTGMNTLFEQGYEYFLEMGPKPVLSNLGQACQPSTATATWLPSLKPKKADWQVLLTSLSTLYVQGMDINWVEFDRDYPRRLLTLPTYPFQRKHYWIDQEKTGVMQLNQTLEKNDQTNVNIQSRKDTILSTLRTLTADLLQATPSEIDVDMPLLEMGVDSLVIQQAGRKIENTFGVTITIRQFFEELNTLEALTTYIDQHISPEWASADLPSAASEDEQQQPDVVAKPATHGIPNREDGGVVSNTSLERIMMQQLQAASQAVQTVSQVVSQQLEVLRGQSTADVSSPLAQSPQQTSAEASKEKIKLEHELTKPPSPSSFWESGIQPAKKLNTQQQRHLEALIARYTKRTQKSKQQEQTYRPVFADMRSVLGFRMETKEMCYPIIAQSFQGSKMWDIDDNEYIDITLGFGVHFFGHQPDFIAAALEEPLKQGMSLGPQSKLAGEVAELICELTGMQRVTFCNSGTEAVMTALRIARAATGRDKMVLFSGAYHGHFDGTLAVTPTEETQLGAVPMAPGVLQKMVDDILVLPYDTPQSLSTIKAHAGELAAVLVEPVQSRRPDLQPKAFLHELRDITKASGTALIFDEMITGFRIHPGGAQAWFGVEADIATYGKVIGGGMPIGIVAGKAAYMARIDGGLWQYGNASYPKVEKTFYAGTFCKHPLAMATTRAVLKHLKTHGPALQQQLNRRTTYLAETLNAYFEKNGVPIRVVHFCSLFRFALAGNLSYFYQPLEMDLLFYHMIEKGIYIWEGRICFLSTAHTDEDIEYVIRAVKDSVKELQGGGFLPGGGTPKNSTPNLDKEKEDTSGSVQAQISLTQAQKQLWVLTKIGDEGSLAYNVYLRLLLQGNFNLVAMRQAVQQVVDRHEALRTIINSEGYFQQCLPSLPIEVPLVDFSGELAQERELKMASFFDQESHKSFDLSQGPLIRVHLIKLEEQQHLLVLTAHHIVVDGLSMNLIVQEIGDLYSVACQGTSCQLEPPMQFCEYVRWQTQQSQTAEMAAQEAYWLEKFYGPIPVLDLPTYRPHPPVRSYRGGRQTVLLPAELCRDLKELSQKQACTPFMTFLSAYTIWLHRLTGQNQILVGIPVTGRNIEGSEKLVGYCAHLLPIQSHIAGPETFLAYLKAMRGILLDAYEHQDYPFANLINKLNLQRDSSHSPLVSVTFNLDKSSELPKMSELEVKWFSQPIHFTAFDISVNLTEIGKEMVLDCDYNLDLFDATTIERFVGHFQTLLWEIAAHPEKRIDELPLLTQAEQQQLLAWNETTTDYPRDKTIVDLFEQQVDQTPEAIAVVFEDQALTYQELNIKANQLAHYLHSLGVKPEVLVGIFLERSLEMVIGLLGILKAGGAYLPLDPAYPAARLAFMLEDAGVPVLLTQSSLKEGLPETTATVVCLDTEAEKLSQWSAENLASDVGPLNLAYVIYTSGSTGQPKGVAVPHQAVNRLVFNTNYIQLESSDRIAQASNVSFDAATFEIWGALLHGAQLVGIAKDIALSPQEFLASLREQKITVLFLTTALFNQLAREVPFIFNGIRYILFGGEAVEPKWVAEILKHGRPQRLLHVYGPTENTTFSSWHLVENVPEGAITIPIGRPISNTQLFVLDKYLQPSPIGVPGELHIGGAGLARGYLNRPELTQEKFIKNPFSEEPGSRLYKTGDLARYLPDGNIEYLGRIDNQVKIRGFRIELGEIEAVLGQHPALRENAVVVHETDKRLVAYIVPYCEQVIENTELRAFMKERLPDYMIPSALVTLESLPLTPNGKIDRQALSQLSVNHDISEEQFVAPRTPQEELLAGIWADVLNIERVGVHDNFFELGGDSIISIQVISRANQACLQLTPRQLFQHQTIAELATVANTGISRQAEQGLVTGSVPLTPIQHWFFEQNLPEPHHFNQSVLLKVSPELQPEQLEPIVLQLLQHHDVLRLRFSENREQLITDNCSLITDNCSLITVKDLSELTPDEQRTMIETTAAELQASLNLGKGPLLRVAWFQLGNEQANRLFFVIHHLAVDGVSWRILLEDFTTAYQQLSRGEVIALPPKTTSFQQWARRLTEYAVSDTLNAELEEWLTNARWQVKPLPVDYPTEPPANTVANTAQVTVSLSVEQTRALLSEVPSAYRTQINDVLLTALVQSFAQWTGEKVLLIDLEGHGRDELFEEVDLSRTVGWFTSLFPVLLDLRTVANDAGATLKAIKEQLRRIPRHGIGYGLLRYLKTDAASRLQALPQAQVSFNYLGQFHQFSTEPLLGFASEDSGAEHGALNPRYHLLDINGLISDGQLHLSWHYSENYFQRSTIERLAQSFITALQALIVHCQSQEVGDYTPSDVLSSKLSQKSLDKLLTKLKK
jgi:amino acid adenylation domain-containing protein/non-ribosomal peptide synthase protein (TIGR01720 family)